jgi:uncharacterized membrane protein YkvA (DUF1232 family)
VHVAQLIPYIEQGRADERRTAIPGFITPTSTVTATVPLAPEGLDGPTLERLTALARQTTHLSAEQLLDDARRHLEALRVSALRRPFANIQLAVALLDRMHLVAAHWQRVPAHARPWLKAAIAYFATPTGELDDASPYVAFHDDALVLNACLRLAWRDDLCVEPEGEGGRGGGDDG